MPGVGVAPSDALLSTAVSSCLSAAPVLFRYLNAPVPASNLHAIQNAPADTSNRRAVQDAPDAASDLHAVQGAPVPASIPHAAQDDPAAASNRHVVQDASVTASNCHTVHDKLTADPLGSASLLISLQVPVTTALVPAALISCRGQPRLPACSVMLLRPMSLHPPNPRLLLPPAAAGDYCSLPSVTPASYSSDRCPAPASLPLLPAQPIADRDGLPASSVTMTTSSSSSSADAPRRVHFVLPPVEIPAATMHSAPEKTATTPTLRYVCLGARMASQNDKRSSAHQSSDSSKLPTVTPRRDRTFFRSPTAMDEIKSRSKKDNIKDDAPRNKENKKTKRFAKGEIKQQRNSCIKIEL